MIISLLTLFLLAAPSAPIAQDATPRTAAALPQATVTPPVYPNLSCPIMGKPVSTRLFAETEKGRIFVCCKGCVPDILAHVDIAYRTAFPADKRLTNVKCPVTGKDITKDSPTVVLQGFEFQVHDAAAAQAARDESQIVLAKLHDPKLVDVANDLCPVSGTAAVKNAFAVIDGHIVRLSSPRSLEDVQKDPAAVLAKAKELRDKQDRDKKEKERQK